MLKASLLDRCVLSQIQKHAAKNNATTEVIQIYKQCSWGNCSPNGCMLSRFTKADMAKTWSFRSHMLKQRDFSKSGGFTTI